MRWQLCPFELGKAAKSEIGAEDGRGTFNRGWGRVLKEGL